MGEIPTKIAIHFALESTPCQAFRPISKMMSAPVWAAILASTFRSSCLLKPWSSSGASRFRIPQRSIFAFPLILMFPPHYMPYQNRYYRTRGPLQTFLTGSTKQISKSQLLQHEERTVQSGPRLFYSFILLLALFDTTPRALGG